MYTGWVDLPEKLKMLDVLANPWVIGIAGVGAVAEFFADKVMWLDSAWDAIHTLVRPVGGALLALALVPCVSSEALPPSSSAITCHAGSEGSTIASARAVVNTSPEPVSNAVVSTGEDILTGGLLFLALANPVAAVVIAVLILAATIAALVMLRRWLRKVLPPKPAKPA